MIGLERHDLIAPLTTEDHGGPEPIGGFHQEPTGWHRRQDAARLLVMRESALEPVEEEGLVPLQELRGQRPALAQDLIHVRPLSGQAAPSIHQRECEQGRA